jgi:hypothetical protein
MDSGSKVNSLKMKHKNKANSKEYTMNEMTLEQLIATFGEETGKQLHAQLTAGNGGGSQAPFTFLKKIASHGSELGAFGEFVVGVKTEKQTDGTRTVTDAGINLGTDFEFVIVNIGYKYRKWDQAANNGKGRSLSSNIFTKLDQIASAVDSYSGTPVPKSKEDKKEAGWKLVRINAGLVRKDAKSDWVQAIWETDGKLYFTLGEVIGQRSDNGLLAGVLSIHTKLESKGATQFSVIDVAKSNLEVGLPTGFFTSEPTKTMIGEITNEMTKYHAATQYKGAVKAPEASAGADAENHDNW